MHGEFLGRSIIEAEGERARLEYEAEEARTRGWGWKLRVTEEHLDQVLDEIMTIGEIG